MRFSPFTSSSVYAAVITAITARSTPTLALLHVAQNDYLPLHGIFHALTSVVLYIHQVKVSTVRNTHQLFPAYRKIVFYVDSTLAIVRTVLSRNLKLMNLVFRWSKRLQNACVSPKSASKDSCQFSGFTKYSISICSNSRLRNIKSRRLISFRNAFPCCAKPNGKSG